MRLTVVGCSGSFPGPHSPASCYLLESEGTRILLDMGNGSLGALQRHTDIYALDGVVISHLHVDHFIDLCSYYVALKYRPEGPADPVPVWGPPGLEQRLAQAYGQEPDTDMSAQFEVRPIQPRFTVGPFDITTARMAHPVESYGMRVTAGGRTLCYSGDTGPTPGLVDLARGAHVALFEASTLNGQPVPPNLHMTGAESARAAAAAAVDRLMLTHLVPWNPPQLVLAEARAVFPEAALVAPGMTIDV